MTPSEAYENIMQRARRLLYLHDGLVNVRRRRIRRDWKENFCRLMRWPLNSSIERVDSRDALVILRPTATLGPNDFQADALDDLLRSALTFGVSGLDRYVHERVVKGIIAALKATELNRRQEEFSIPAVLALQAADAVRRAGREGRDVRPANEIRKRVQEMLHLRPFQNWRQVEEAFELIGIKGLAGQLQDAYGVGDFTPIRRQLDDIVSRRHRIVHEGDLVRHERGGKTRKNDVSRKYVEESLTFLDTFVGNLGQAA